MRSIEFFEKVNGKNFLLKFKILNKESQNEVDDINLILFWKDVLNISDFNYTCLRSELKLKLPSLYQVKKAQAKVDERFKISLKNDNVYVDFEEKSHFILTKIHEQDTTIKTFRLKFCADGVAVGRNLKVLNFNFSVLNEIEKCKRALGHYSLGIFEVFKENYKELKEHLAHIFLKIDKTDEIILNKISFKLDKYIGGDLKFLLKFAGLNEAKSNYPCLYCTCKKDQFWDHTKKWSIIDIKLGARSFSECERLCSLKKVDDRKGYVEKPLSQIEYFRYIIDILHMFLRISDLLYNLLFIEIQVLEFKVTGQYNENPDIEKTILIKRFRDFLVNICKIKKPLYVDEKKVKKEIKLKDLNGPEKLRLFNNINIVKLLPGYEKRKENQNLWTDFMKLYVALKKNSLTSEEIDVICKQWLQDFVNLNHRSDCTPYVHLTQHLSELIRLHGHIGLFNQEGHERLNQISIVQYFRACNKKISKNSSYLAQILKKRNRIEAISLLYKIQMRKYKKNL